MKFRSILFVLILTGVFSHSFAQSQGTAGGWGDAETAQQYVQWALRAIDEGRMSEALAGLERAADFANVSSDISYLLAAAYSREGRSRVSVVETLDTAIETNRWVVYDENTALLLKAGQLVALRSYISAISCLDQIGKNVLSSDAGLQADAAMLRLLAYRGMALSSAVTEGYDPVPASARFRSLVLSTMDRYPRDPRPLKIFFEYARNRRPEAPELPDSDLNLMELALRRLPFLLEADPELAWMAAGFLRNIEDGRRYTASYRSGGLPDIHNRDFSPSHGSIPVALNLGLLDDADAVEELFSGTRGFNSPAPYVLDSEDPVLDKDILTDVFNLLRSDAGRDLFTQKLLAFSGSIFSDDDRDGYIDSRSFYSSGVLKTFEFDRDQDNIFDFWVSFSADGLPVSAEVPVAGQLSTARIQWERYPYVERAELAAGESFYFRPADLNFAPVSFIVLGGSRNHSGLAYPVPSGRLELTRRTLVSFCSSLSRPSVEFDGALEQIFFERGIPRQAFEILGGQHVSVTEFDGGTPVAQFLDLDLDGRMETIRRFRRPDTVYQRTDLEERFDFRGLIVSSESDWTGDGRYKTGEAYLQDGSVVYLWDMDGGGVMNYSETETGNR